MLTHRPIDGGSAATSAATPPYPPNAEPTARVPGPSRRSILAALALGALASLTKCANLDNFDVPVSAQEKIPAGTLVDELLGALDFKALQSIDLTAELKNQGVTKDDVDSVRLTSFTLRIDAPAGATFDFLTSISFFIETDGQPKQRIARLDSVPPGSTSLTLIVEPNVELKPYVVAPSMRITGEVQGKRPKEETTVSADVTLDVDVTVPGC